MKFRCWRPKHDEEIDGEIIYGSLSAEGAAESFVGRHYDDFEYPEEETVAVRPLPEMTGPEEFPIQTFVVEVSTEPVCYARPKK